MGFMSGLTAFGVGAVQEGNAAFDRADKLQMEQNKEDAKKMDISISKYAESKKLATKMKTNYDSLVSSNIDPNIARNVAYESKNVDKDLDVLLDQARRGTLQTNPDGTPKMLPAVAETKTMLQPAATIRKPGLITPGVTQKEISYGNGDALPERQAVAFTPKLDPALMNYIKDFKPNSDKEVQKAQMDVMTAVNEGRQPDPATVIKARGTGLDEQHDKAFTLTVNGLKDQSINQQNADQAYRQAGGPKTGIDWSVYGAKPERDTNLDNRLALAKKWVPNWFAEQQAAGLVKEIRDQTDPNKIVGIQFYDPNTGAVRVVSPGEQLPTYQGKNSKNVSGLQQASQTTAAPATPIKATGPENSPDYFANDKSAKPTQIAAAPSAAPSPAPSPIAPTATAQPVRPANGGTETSGVAMPPAPADRWKPNPNTNPDEWKPAGQNVINMTKNISVMKDVLDAAHTPEGEQAFGWKALVVKHGGGAAYNLASALPFGLGEYLANATDNTLGLSQNAELRSKLAYFEANMARQILQERSNVAVAERAMVKEIANGGSGLNENVAQLQGNLKTLYNIMMNSAVKDASVRWYIPPAERQALANQDLGVQKSRYELFTGLGYEPAMANELVRRERLMAQGKALPTGREKGKIQ